MLAATVSRVANHLLAPADWARARLVPHAGKAARFELAPVRVNLQIAPDGLLQPAAADAEPAVTIRFQPGALLQTLADREQAWRAAHIEGDTAFAADISFVAAHLDWDAEEDLSKVFGDVAAHRMAQAGRSAAAWPGQAARSVAHNTAEYLTEEAKLLASPLQVGEFVRQVDELRDAVERLEKRIDQLTRR